MTKLPDYLNKRIPCALCLAGAQGKCPKLPLDTTCLNARQRVIRLAMTKYAMTKAPNHPIGLNGPSKGTDETLA